MKLVGCAVMALTMIAGSASAGDWRWFYTSRDTLYFVDVSSIRETSGKKFAWMTYANRNISPGQADYLVARGEFDCAAETMATRNVTGYRKDSSVIRSEQSQRAAEPVIPDTAGMAALNAVCLNSFSDVRLDTPREVYQTAISYWQEEDAD